MTGGSERRRPCCQAEAATVRLAHVSVAARLARSPCSALLRSHQRSHRPGPAACAPGLAAPAPLPGPPPALPGVRPIPPLPCQRSRPTVLVSTVPGPALETDFSPGRRSTPTPPLPACASAHGEAGTAHPEPGRTRVSCRSMWFSCCEHLQGERHSDRSSALAGATSAPGRGGLGARGTFWGTAAFYATCAEPSGPGGSSHQAGLWGHGRTVASDQPSEYLGLNSNKHTTHTCFVEF